MVTSRQLARGMVRTMRAMDRAAKQAERQRIARQNASHRAAMLDASAQAVADYEEMVEALTGGHRFTFGKRDWLTAATAPDEPHPARRDDEELAARARLDGYVPGFLDKVLRRGEKVVARLADDIDAARRRDDDLHARTAKAVASMNAQAAVARKVVERDRTPWSQHSSSTATLGGSRSPSKASTRSSWTDASSPSSTVSTSRICPTSP